jgi:enoyl-CoA hydratase/carnithine racemase
VEVSAVPGPAAQDDELRFEVINGVGVITLHRPQALNALSMNMLQALPGLLDVCERDAGIRAVLLRGAGPKAFCAGGDVLALARSVAEGTPLHRQFFIDEYRLDHRLHHYPKPVIAFLHGIVMGGGMGLAQGASLRLVTANSRLAMPEARIGLIPDVGATHFFARMPAPLALYLALTGTPLNAGDAIFCGLADARSRLEQPGQLDEALRDIVWVADVLADVRRALCAPQATSLAGATLPALCEAIYRHFDPARPVVDIIESLLLEEAPQHLGWARDTLQTLRSRSPLMLSLCHEALRRGRRASLAACFRMEFDVVQAALASGEFTEGVRAYLIDKDQQPRWQPARLEEVSPQMVQRCFAAGHAAPHPLAGLAD